MDTSVHPFSNLISDDDKARVTDGLTLRYFKANVPEVAEKREYPIVDSDGLNVIEDTLRSDPAQRKSVSVIVLADELKGFMITESPAGRMMTTAFKKEEV